jgi:2-iminobutanoate/2-iminopropanoate deaminase
VKIKYQGEIMEAVGTEATIIGKADETFSKGEKIEMRKLGILDEDDNILSLAPVPAQVARTPIESKDVLNEAYDYCLPSSFTRGLKVKIEAGQQILYLSGTASINEEGDTVYEGDLRAQTWRTYRNLNQLLASEGATWHDVVRTSCYLRDIERDYDEFNKLRTLFFRCFGISPLPASTGIQARLCRSDLLIEIELFAFIKS